MPGFQVVDDMLLITLERLACADEDSFGQFYGTVHPDEQSTRENRIDESGGVANQCPVSSNDTFRNQLVVSIFHDRSQTFCLSRDRLENRILSQHFVVLFLLCSAELWKELPTKHHSN